MIGVTLFLTTMSRHSIAKYGVDSTIEIRHNVHLNRRFRAVDVFRSRTRSMSHLAGRITHPSRRSEFEGEEGPPTPLLHLLRVAAKSLVFCMGFGVFAYLIYSSVLIAIAVPRAQWDTFLSSTPYLLFSMGADYLRVLAVTGASVCRSYNPRIRPGNAPKGKFGGRTHYSSGSRFSSPYIFSSNLHCNPAHCQRCIAILFRGDLRVHPRLP